MTELKNDMPETQILLAESLIYLVNCAVNEVAPEHDKVKKVDLQELYRLAERHCLLAVCCMALEQTDVFLSATNRLRRNG